MAAARIAAPRLGAAWAPRRALPQRSAPAGPAPVQLTPRSVAAAAVVASSSSGGLQRPLTNQERKAKRAEAQRLGRQLCTVNLGQKGMTPAFIEGFRLALAANELVKVKVGACDESEEEVIEALCAAGDCVLVHKIGFTLTFFRDQSLPPAPPYRPRRPAAAAAAVAAAGSEGGPEGEDESASDDEAVEMYDDELAAYLESEDAFSDSDSEGESEAEEEEDAGPPNSARRQAAAARAARGRRPPPPPEFTVIS
ncbi:RNA-binding [Chlorella sorokiniana]|uniref:RNA-binding n=1 Tax=Chlorella sorokiniana TaxID=3076 RepID=A0A2P6TNM9_CHLSO|nr:RNA-binding [Chlorella sorokiniana]|eukprot:PRW50947.1 RNA-binding [Chlorella sorokiniana]